MNLKPQFKQIPRSAANYSRITVGPNCGRKQSAKWNLLFFAVAFAFAVTHVHPQSVAYSVCVCAAFLPHTVAMSSINMLTYLCCLVLNSYFSRDHSATAAPCRPLQVRPGAVALYHDLSKHRDQKNPEAVAKMGRYDGGCGNTNECYRVVRATKKKKSTHIRRRKIYVARFPSEGWRSAGRQCALALARRSIRRSRSCVCWNPE